MPIGIHKRKPRSEETKRKIAITLTGRKQSEETKRKRSLTLKSLGPNGGTFKKGIIPWNKGRIGVYSKETLDKFSKAHKGAVGYWLGKKRPEITGKKNVSWKGDSVGYGALHQWVYKHLGKPTKCEDCRIDGLTSYQIHWANISGKYKRDLNDWKRLCVDCHLKFDGTAIKKGQHLSPETEFKPREYS